MLSLTPTITVTLLTLILGTVVNMAPKLDSQPFRSRANSLPEANRPIGPWSICFHSLALMLPGLLAPGTFVPRSDFRSLELSHSSVFAPRNIRSLELSFPVSP